MSRPSIASSQKPMAASRSPTLVALTASTNGWTYQHDPEIVASDFVQCLRTIACDINLETSIGQECTQATSCSVIVINNQHVALSH